MASERQTLEAFLLARGVELDQRLNNAAAITREGETRDSIIFFELYRQNSSLTRLIDLDPARLSITNHLLERDHSPAKEPVIDKFSKDILERALELRKHPLTIGTGDFLRAVIEVGMEKGDDYPNRPFSIDILADMLGESPTTPISKLPRVVGLLQAIREKAFTDEDFQYVLAVEGDRIVFRIVSTLGDYVQENDSGLLVPQRAVLTHFQDSFGGFTIAEISELEDLLNSTLAKELDYQRFFERHPHFLRMSDYREVYSHVTLGRSEGPLIPDFLLTDRELQRAAIVELKLPTPKVVRRQHNRDRFSDALMGARAQLLLYKEWFRDPQNRSKLCSAVGMEIYEPRMIVVIGRSSEFRDEIDRQRLRASHPDVDVLTYDDILAKARRRQIIISGG